jgi:hypothetical protein
MVATMGKTNPGELEQTIRQTLVVMDNVVDRFLFPEILIYPLTEGERFRKAPGTHGQKFHLVQWRQQVTVILHLEEVIRIVEIQPRQGMKGYAIHQLRIWRAGDDLHTVSQIPQGPAQVFDVDSWPPEVGFPR